MRSMKYACTLKINSGHIELAAVEVPYVGQLQKVKVNHQPNRLKSNMLDLVYFYPHKSKDKLENFIHV